MHAKIKKICNVGGGRVADKSVVHTAFGTGPLDEGIKFIQ